MTIFVKEYVIFWWEIGNWFLLDYVNNYEATYVTFFNNMDYCYANGATEFFSDRKGRWVLWEFYNEKGRVFLRNVITERLFVKRKMAYIYRPSLYGLKGTEYYFNNYFFLKEDLFVLNFYSGKAQVNSCWWFGLRAKEWRFFSRNFLDVVATTFPDINPNKFKYYLGYLTWSQMYCYVLGSVNSVYLTSRYYLTFFYLNDFYFLFENPNGLISIIYNYISFVFYNNYYNFFIVDVFLVFFYIFIYFLDWFYCLFIFFFIKFLWFHFFYDIIFLFFFLNKRMLNRILNFALILFNYYEPMRYNIASMRIWKNNIFFEQNHSWFNYLKKKNISRKNYSIFQFKYILKFIKIIKNIFVKEKVNIFEKLKLQDDKTRFIIPFFLNLNLNIKGLIRFEWFITWLTYIFNVKFYLDLVDLKSVKHLLTIYHLSFFTVIFFSFHKLYIVFRFLYFRFLFLYFGVLFSNPVKNWYTVTDTELGYEAAEEDNLFDEEYYGLANVILFWLKYIGYEKSHSWYFFPRVRERLFREYELAKQKAEVKEDYPEEAVEEVEQDYIQKKGPFMLHNLYKGHFKWEFKKLFNTIVRGYFFKSHYCTQMDTIISEWDFILLYLEYWEPMRHCIAGKNFFLSFSFYFYKFFIKTIYPFCLIILKKSYSFWTYYIFYWFFYFNYMIFYILDKSVIFFFRNFRFSRVYFLYNFYLFFLILKNYFFRYQLIRFFYYVIIYTLLFFKNYIYIPFLKTLEIIFSFEINVNISNSTYLRLISLFRFALRYNIFYKMTFFIFWRLFIILLAVWLIVFLIDYNKIIYFFYLVGWVDNFYNSINLIKEYGILNFIYLNWIIDWIQGQDIITFLYPYNSTINGSGLEDWWIRYIRRYYSLWQIKQDWKNIFVLMKNDFEDFIGYKFDFDIKWILFQIKMFWGYDYGFFRLRLVLLEFKFHMYYHFFIRTYGFFFFYMLYFTFEWFYNYFIYSFVIYCEYNYYLYTENIITYINMMFKFTNFFKNIYIFIYNYFYLIISDYFVHEIQIISENYKFNYNLIKKYEVVKFYFFVDILMLIEYNWLYIYYNLYYHTYNFIYFIYNILIWFFNWIIPLNLFKIYPYKILESFELFNYYFTVPFYMLFSKFFIYFIDDSFDHYKYIKELPIQDLGYYFPFTILRGQEFVTPTSPNRFFFMNIIMKLSMLEHCILYNKWHFNSSSFTNLFLFSYIHACFVMIFFMFLFTTFTKFSFLKDKSQLSVSSANLWDKFSEKSRHKFTQFEHDWFFGLNNIYTFDLYLHREDMFKNDPFLYDKVWYNYTDGAGLFLYKYLMNVYMNPLTRRRFKKKYRTFGWFSLDNLDNYYRRIFRRTIGPASSSIDDNECRDFFEQLLYLNEEDSINFDLGDEFFYHVAKYGETHYDYFTLYSDMNKNYYRWLTKFVLPYMYMYCDDPFFVKNYMKNIKDDHLIEKDDIWRYIWKLQTIMNEKYKWSLFFPEFYFTDREFYQRLLSESEHIEDRESVFGNLMDSFSKAQVVFKPYYHRLHSLFKENIYKDLYKVEDFFYKLGYYDHILFKDRLNFTFYNTFEWPTIQKTRIVEEQLFALYDSRKENEAPLEMTKFFPHDTGIYRGDIESNYEIQNRVNDYWRTVLKKIKGSSRYSEIGLFHINLKVVFPQVYTFYWPLFAVSATFWHSFQSHLFYEDPFFNMAVLLIPLLDIIDYELATFLTAISTDALNYFAITEDSLTLDYHFFFSWDGIGFQTFLLHDSYIPLDYQILNIIYGYPSIDIYPYYDFFSDWEHEYRYHKYLVTNNVTSNIVYLKTWPYGLNIYEIDKSMQEDMDYDRRYTWFDFRFPLYNYYKSLKVNFIVNIVSLFYRIIIPISFYYFFFIFIIIIIMQFYFFNIYSLWFEENPIFRRNIVTNRIYGLFSKK